MTLVRLGGGLWTPFSASPFSSIPLSGQDLTLDADEEEVQLLGRVYLAAGSGTKTFGTTGSLIAWLPGASITFSTGSTLRVGVKKSSTWDDAAGPVGRATIGAAAFDVYDDLVGGTDTITATTYREDTMTAGTPFTVTHGDRLAICFHLETTSGSPSVKYRSAASPSSFAFPVTSLVTTGPVHTIQSRQPNAVLKFDDSTFGWLDMSYIFSSGTPQETVGNTNLYGNVIRFPAEVKIDAVGVTMATAGTTNFDLGFWSDPFGTPTPITNGTVSVDPQNMGIAAQNTSYMLLSAEITLAANTDYFLAVKQNSATGLGVVYHDVAVAAYWQANALDSNTYAAKSTAGAAVVQAVSGTRRATVFARVSSIHDGTGGGGGLNVLGGIGGVIQ